MRRKNKKPFKFDKILIRINLRDNIWIFFAKDPDINKLINIFNLDQKDYYNILILCKKIGEIKDKNLRKKVRYCLHNNGKIFIQKRIGFFDLFSKNYLFEIEFVYRQCNIMNGGILL